MNDYGKVMATFKKKILFTISLLIYIYQLELNYISQNQVKTIYSENI